MQLRLPRADVAVFAAKVLGVIEDRVLQLIDAVVRAGSVPPD